MADYLPQISSNWTTATWITAFSNLTAFAGNPPMSADDVYADGKTITIDTNINVATLRTTTAPRTGGVAGGGFRATNNTSLTANLLAGPTTCLTFASAAPNFFTLFGNITASATVNSDAFVNNNTGTSNIFGSLRGQHGSAVGNYSSGIINIVGTTIGGSGSSDTNGGRSISNIGTSAIVNLTGNCLGGNFAFISFITSILNAGTSSVVNISGNLTSTGGIAILRNTGINAIANIRGNISGTSGGTVIVCTGANSIVNIVGNVFQNQTVTPSDLPAITQSTSTATLNITGDLFGGNQTGTNTGGAVYNSAGTVNLYGNAYGGINSGTNYGLLNDGGTANVYGNVIGGFNSDRRSAGLGNGSIFSATSRSNVFGSAIGRTSFGIDNGSSNTVYVTRVVGGSGGPTNPTAGTAVGLSNSQNGLAYAEEIAFGDQGATPVSGPVFLVNRTNTVLVMEGPPPTFTSTTLFGNLNVPNLFPPVSSVRLGITYGNGDFTGTMVIPPAQAVQVGVPVDNTVGTFVLSPESFWTIKRANSAFNDPTTIGYRIKNLATTASVGQQIASFNLYPPMSTFNIL